jgi:hypothetical protein
MYKELEKYKTGRVQPDYTLGTSEGNCFTIKSEEYKIPLGSILNDFIEHKNKPFWKRKYYHNHLTELYIKFLNQLTLISCL